MSEPTFYWHIHHDVLVEPATEPIEQRSEYIRQRKPANQIETRLRLLKPVKGELPQAFVEARRAYDEASRAYEEAWLAYDEASRAYEEAWLAYEEAWLACEEARRAYHEVWLAYDDARGAHKTEIEALHAQECPDCPWDGKTIFPKELR
jgi:hypothetical protein